MTNHYNAISSNTDHSTSLSVWPGAHFGHINVAKCHFRQNSSTDLAKIWPKFLPAKGQPSNQSQSWYAV